MFAQIIVGKTRDGAAMQATAERWDAELRPGAKGILGVTSGVADDGTAFTIVRFDSEADAKANSARPEQGRFWQEMPRTTRVSRRSTTARRSTCSARVARTTPDSSRR
jgi:hypothetical protein